MTPRRIDLGPGDLLDDERLAGLRGRLLDADTVPIRHVLRDEPADVYKPDGTLLACFRPRVLSREACHEAEPTFVAAAQLPSRNRARTMGIRSNDARVVRDDGTVSRTRQVDFRRYPALKEVGSAVVGAFDRYVRYPYCRLTQFTTDHTDLIERGLPLVRAISDAFREAVPERWAVQRAFCERTNPAWIMPGTVFSTITVNRDFATAVHADSGDLAEGFGCLAVLRAGVYSGGWTVLVRYGVAADLSTRDVLFYDVHELHANTPIVGRPGMHRRVALVCYLRERMVMCGSPQHELAQAQRRRRGDPVWTEAEREHARRVRAEILS